MGLGYINMSFDPDLLIGSERVHLCQNHPRADIVHVNIQLHQNKDCLALLQVYASSIKQDNGQLHLGSTKQGPQKPSGAMVRQQLLIDVADCSTKV